MYKSCKILIYLTKDTDVKRKDTNTLQAGVDAAYISIVFSCSFLLMWVLGGGYVRAEKEANFLFYLCPFIQG